MSSDSSSSTPPPSRVFYNLDEFPQLRVLQDHWREIAAELAALPRTTLDLDRTQRTWGAGARAFVERMKLECGWVFAWQAKQPGEAETRNNDWLNFGLVFEDHPIGLNAAACPLTCGLLASMRGIHAAGFSLLKPGAAIWPHTDTTGAEFGNLAFHLGLDVPPADCGECALEVVAPDGEVVRAVEANGEVVIFDACHTHSAFNRSTHERTILYIDFEIENAQQPLTA